MNSALIKDVVENKLGCKVHGVKYLGGGSYGRAYKVDIDTPPHVVVVKAYLLKDMHKKEAYQLKVLAQHCTVKMPEVYFTCDSTADIPFDCMCMEFLEGKDAFTDFRLLFKSKKAKRHFAETVVDGMLSIHSFTNDKFGDIENPTYDSWQDYYRPFAKDIYEKAEQLNSAGKYPDKFFDVVREAWPLYDEIFSEEVTSAALIHGDLNVMNVMVKKPFEVVGFIDPLKTMYADREYDLFQLNNLTGKCFGLYNVYKEKYPVSKNCDIKCAFYALYHEIYCYLNTGRYTGFIMKAVVREMKKQLKLFKAIR